MEWSDSIRKSGQASLAARDCGPANRRTDSVLGSIDKLFDLAAYLRRIGVDVPDDARFLTVDS